jgi:diguanylate cyclase (GGDEF)-like protein/PAS domain S-box-containing protein
VTGDDLDDGEWRRDFIACAPVGMYRTTVDGRYLWVNMALARMYGFTSPDDLIHSFWDIGSQLYVDPRRRLDFAREVLEADGVRDFDAEIYRHDGTKIWIRENARCVRNFQGHVGYYEGMVTDITGQKHAEERVRLLVTAFDNVAEGVVIIDHHMRIHWANQAMTTITGYPIQDLVGESLALPVLSDDTAGTLNDIWEHVQQCRAWQGEQTLRRKNGEPFLAWLSMAIAAGDASRPDSLRFVIACTDITQRKRIEERLKFHAHHDSLTTLPNRALLRSRLDQEIQRAQETDSMIAVCYIDLDRFKPVNDRFGHHAGDQLLKLAAKRMRNSLRLSDTVGRLGGDEFLIIATDIAGRGAASYIADKIRYSYSDPFDIHGNEVFCTASIGIALYPGDGTTVDELIGNADLAMYHAKHHEPNRYCFFEDRMRTTNINAFDLDGDLRRALLRDEFILHYQPKQDLNTGIITSAEALIRWRHPTLGMVPPGDFIPLAETNGLIRSIGLWTLRLACYQMQEWITMGTTIGHVAVNLSPVQFNDDKLVQVVRQVLDETGLAADALELELTEGAIITDVERAVSIMTELKEIGVRMAIDDFGTGYSSLAYLKRFPIDTLKIDRSFVSDLETDVKDQAIVATILELGKNLGFSVVAEGVETTDQRDFLRERGCHIAQGYLIGRPMDGKALSALAGGWPAAAILPMSNSRIDKQAVPEPFSTAKART